MTYVECTLHNLKRGDAMRLLTNALSLPKFFLVALSLGILGSGPASAMPDFARKYSLSCIACHAAFPRLNQFGEQFRKNNMRLPNWMEKTVATGDERLALPAYPPLAIRARPTSRPGTANRSIRSPGRLSAPAPTSSRPI